MDAESNDINPEIMDEVKNMWGRKDFILEVTKLKIYL